MDLPELLRHQTLIGLQGNDLEHLEAEADRILADARKGVTAHSEKKDYLSASQLEWRRAREVYPNSGVPDKAFFSGVFSRVYRANLRAQGRNNMEDEE